MKRKSLANNNSNKKRILWNVLIPFISAGIALGVTLPIVLCSNKSDKPDNPNNPDGPTKPTSMSVNGLPYAQSTHTGTTGRLPFQVIDNLGNLVADCNGVVTLSDGGNPINGISISNQGNGNYEFIWSNTVPAKNSYELTVTMSNHVIPYNATTSIKLTMNPTLGQITLRDGAPIIISSVSDFNKLCNAGDADTSITIGERTFTKKNLTSFTFGSDFNSASIGNNFLANCTAFNSLLAIPNTVGTVGTNFLDNCTSFNKSIVLPNGLAQINDDFMSGCTAFNTQFTIPSTVTQITNNFLSKCTSFNKPIILPDGLTRIQSNFLNGCDKFNQPLTIPTSCSGIYPGFLMSCSIFDNDVTCPGRTIKDNNWQTTNAFSGTHLIDGWNDDKIHYDDPSTATGFFQITITNGLKKIGVSSEFAQFCANLSSTSGLRVDGQSLTRGTLACFTFGPDFNLDTIPDYFCMNCTSLNQKIIIPDTVKNIGNNFLGNCVALNQPLVLPNNVSTGDPITIGSNFLGGCSTFNKQLTLPTNVTTIGSYFLTGDQKFNRALAIPNSVTDIGSNFLGGCTNFNSNVYCPGTASRPNTWSDTNAFAGTDLATLGWGDPRVRWNEPLPITIFNQRFYWSKSLG